MLDLTRSCACRRCIQVGPEIVLTVFFVSCATGLDSIGPKALSELLHEMLLTFIHSSKVPILKPSQVEQIHRKIHQHVPLGTIPTSSVHFYVSYESQASQAETDNFYFSSQSPQSDHSQRATGHCKLTPSFPNHNHLVSRAAIVPRP